MRLLHDLERAGYLTGTNVELLARFCQKWQVNAYAALLQTHILTEHSLADAIAETYKLERLYSFDPQDVDIEALKRIPFSKALEFQCFVPYKDEKNSHIVYLLNPNDEDLASYLRNVLGNYKAVILDKRLMHRSIEDVYPLHMQLPSLILE